MCSINGCYLREKYRTPEMLESIQNDLIKLCLRAAKRGRDSFGIVSIDRDNGHLEAKCIGGPQNVFLPENFVNEKTVVVMANNRAEPTTEWVENKTPFDIQPFYDPESGIHIVHNGTIANDQALREEIGLLDPPTKIDTYALLAYLSAKWDKTLSGLQKILRDDVVGSFALALHSSYCPNDLVLATNYKPLFVMNDANRDVLWFSSLPSFLQPYSTLRTMQPIKQIGPYEIVSLNPLLEEVHFSLYPTKVPKKVLVICSGGLDSTVVATQYVRQKYDVTLLHFQYSCRAQNSEERALRNVAEELGCEVMVVPMDNLFKSIIGHSRLTDTGGTLMVERGGEASAELAYEWVPARNLIFYSIATGIAEAYGFDIIALGGNLEESGAYPDNEAIFTLAFRDVLPYAVNLGKRVQVEMPVGNLMKHEIVKLGLELDAPLDKTWSCYEDADKPCGICGPDYMRRVAFKMNGVKDPYEYFHNVDEGYWNGCVQYKQTEKK